MLEQWRAARRMAALAAVVISLFLTLLLLQRLFSRNPSKRMQICSRLMRRHLVAMAWVGGLRIHLRGQVPAADEVFLLLANHVSYWDIIALGSLRTISFVAKKNIESWPLLGQVTVACNTIFVERESVIGRWKALRRLQKASVESSYCVFPEGTTTAGVSPSLRRWCRGNIAILKDPGIPIYIAGLHYTDHPRQAWIDDNSLIPHLWRSLQNPSTDLMLRIEPFVGNPGLPLADAAVQAWKQCSMLCQQAEKDTMSSLQSLNCKEFAPNAAVS